MTYQSKTLDRVTRGQLCAGCGGCAAAAPEKIAMRIDAAGFARPHQVATVSDEEEGRIASICPSTSMIQNPAGRIDHVLWGPVRSVHQGWARNSKLRHHGSSGGALSAFLTHLIESGEVAFVAQTTADTQVPTANRQTASSSAKDIYDAAGSRYAPSSPLADLETWLAREEPFAFVGKPCDIAALRALAKIDTRIDRFVPYMVSFFCAGVPSLKGADRIIATLGAERDDVTAFQYRGDGWPGYAAATLKSGDIKKMSYHDSWGKILTQHLQYRCKICPDGTGGFADIVFADAWHCDEKGYPLFEEQDGRSLIVVRTEKGARALANAVAAHHIDEEPCDLQAIAPMQPGQVRRKRLAFSRLMALTALLRPAPHFQGFNLGAAAKSAGLMENLRSFLGSCRRILLDQR